MHDEYRNIGVAHYSVGLGIGHWSDCADNLRDAGGFFRDYIIDYWHYVDQATE